MKKALLVGINYPGTDHALRGCINDVVAMSEILSKDYGFESKNKRMLTDASATTANILNRLEWLVDGAKAGDVLYFHYSGHGSQFVDQQYDNDFEPDGLDEILCPIDLNWRDKIIKDDDLRDIFAKVPEGVNLTVMLDCCHSGSGIDVGQANENVTYTTRSMIPELSGPNLSRNLPAPMDIMNRGIGLNITNKPKTVAEDNKGVLISGCQSNQTSADAWMHNKFMGAATYFLIQALEQTTAYSNIVEHMNFNMIEHGYTQRPQFNGNDYYRNQNFLEPLQQTIL